MSVFPSFQTPARTYDMSGMYDSATRSLGPDTPASTYPNDAYMSYETPARYQYIQQQEQFTTPQQYQQVVTSQYQPAVESYSCHCIHCDEARKQLHQKYQQQNTPVQYVEQQSQPAAQVAPMPAAPVESVPAAPPQTELAEAEDVTPKKSVKAKAPRSGKKKESPAHYAVTVRCRHKRCDFMSKFPVAAGEYVFVEGDRGEDVGEVIGCEKVDPTSATAPKTIGSVLRPAKLSEVDAFHSLSDEESDCVRTCQRMVEALHLPLVVVRAAYQYDRKKLTFFYEASERVDFRALLHDLYQEYRCRIWMERIE